MNGFTTGQKFGYLTVISYIGKTGKENRPTYKCRCTCGKEIPVLAKHLKSGNTTSCGCGRARVMLEDMYGKNFEYFRPTSFSHKKGKSIYLNCVCLRCGGETVKQKRDVLSGRLKSCGCLSQPDLVGKRFGKLIVQEYLGMEGHNRTWLCKCDCGNTSKVTTERLNSGVQSCGCYRLEQITTHGQTGTRLYHIYHQMKSRCHNPNSPDYKYYGERGIAVYPKWRKSFVEFRKYVEANLGDFPTPEHTLDRIDNDKGYEPGNIRFATREEQQNNTRWNRKVVFKGQELTLAQLAKQENINYRKLYGLIAEKEMPAEMAVNQLKS